MCNLAQVEELNEKSVIQSLALMAGLVHHYVSMSVCIELSSLVLSDSAFFSITIVAKAIFAIFDSITIVHFSLIKEIQFYE